MLEERLEDLLESEPVDEIGKQIVSEPVGERGGGPESELADETETQVVSEPVGERDGGPENEPADETEIQSASEPVDERDGGLERVLDLRFVYEIDVFGFVHLAR